MKLMYSASIACTKAASAVDAPNATAIGASVSSAQASGDLAVMRVPEFRKQQRTDGDGQENAGERQRPGPAHLRAVERRRGVGGGGSEDQRQSGDEKAATDPELA